MDSGELLASTRRTAQACVAEGTFTQVEVSVSDGVRDLDGFTVTSIPSEKRGTTLLPLWTCTGKSLLAAGVGLLVAAGRAAFEDPLPRYLPELDTGRWPRVRLADVLSNSLSLRCDEAARSAFRDNSDVLTSLRYATVPESGTRGAELLWTTGFLIGQVIERITGEPCERFLREEIIHPLAMTETLLAARPHRAVEYATEAARVLRASSDRPAGPTDIRRDLFWPGMSTDGSMRDLARVLAVFLPGARGLALPAEIAARMTTPHSTGTEGDTAVSLAWGLGVVVDRRLAGPRFSAATFGHFGLEGRVLAFADPVLGVSIAVRLCGSKGRLSLPLLRSAIIHAVRTDVRARCG